MKFLHIHILVTGEELPWLESEIPTLIEFAINSRDNERARIREAKQHEENQRRIEKYYQQQSERRERLEKARMKEFTRTTIADVSYRRARYT